MGDILERTTLPWTGSADTSVIIAIEFSEWSHVTIWMSNITFFKYISTINDKYFFLLMLYGTPSYCNVNVYTCISYRFNLLGKSSNSAGPFLKFYPSKLFWNIFFDKYCKILKRWKKLYFFIHINIVGAQATISLKVTTKTMCNI